VFIARTVVHLSIIELPPKLLVSIIDVVFVGVNHYYQSSIHASCNLAVQRHLICIPLSHELIRRAIGTGDVSVRMRRRGKPSAFSNL